MASALGVGFAYIDSRPTWDDGGVLVGAIWIASLMLTAVTATAPFMLAIAVGLGSHCRTSCFMEALHPLRRWRFPCAEALAGAFLRHCVREVAARV